jgi:hypothetical protein
MSESNSELEFADRPYSKKAMSALSLRAAGATLDDIVTIVGFASAKEAATAIDRALRDELRSDPKARDKMRALANDRLERLLRSVWPKALKSDHPEHLAAVGKAKELIDRHIKLYGLDAPTEMVVHNPDSGEIEAWVTSVLAKSQQSLQEIDPLDYVEGEVISEEDDDGPDEVPARIGA